MLCLKEPITSPSLEVYELGIHENQYPVSDIFDTY